MSRQTVIADKNIHLNKCPSFPGHSWWWESRLQWRNAMRLGELVTSGARRRPPQGASFKRAHGNFRGL